MPMWPTAIPSSTPAPVWISADRRGVTARFIVRLRRLIINFHSQIDMMAQAGGMGGVFRSSAIGIEFSDENVQSILSPHGWNTFRLREDDHSMQRTP